jgi:hypothetical protein
VRFKRPKGRILRKLRICSSIAKSRLVRGLSLAQDTSSVSRFTFRPFDGSTPALLTDPQMNCLRLLMTLVAGSLLYGASAGALQATFSGRFEGQNRNSSVWFGGPVLDWKERDLAPLRLELTGGPATPFSTLVRTRTEVRSRFLYRGHALTLINSPCIITKVFPEKADWRLRRLRQPGA